MDNFELQSLKQQARKLEKEVETITLEVHTRLRAVQRHNERVKELEEQHELQLRMLRSKVSKTELSQNPWLNHYYQQELEARQQEFSQARQRHIAEARIIQAEQAQFIARCQAIARQLQRLNEQLLQVELMSLVHS